MENKRVDARERGLVVDELQRVIKKLRTIGEGFGLSFDEIFFEEATMDNLSMVASFGLPNRFTHWYFGGIYKNLKIQQDEKMIQILELVLNTVPSYAFLLDTNTKLENWMVIAHVYGHVDFFRNNRWYKKSDRDMLNKCEQHARFIRRLTPVVGKERLDDVIASVLTITSSVNPFELDKKKAEKRLLYFLAENVPIAMRALPKSDPRRQQLSVAARVLPRMRKEMDYFDLIGRTQVINEGWASFVESRILKDFVSPEDWLTFSLTFGNRPAPYQIGFALFKSIFEQGGWEKCRHVRSLYEDITFVDEFLTQEHCEQLDLFVMNKDSKKKEYDVRRVKERIIYEKLYKGQPLVVVNDYNRKTREITMVNTEKERRLDRKRTELFLASLHKLWPFEMHLRDGEMTFHFGERGFSHERK